MEFLNAPVPEWVALVAVLTSWALAIALTLERRRKPMMIVVQAGPWSPGVISEQQADDGPRPSAFPTKLDRLDTRLSVQAKVVENLQKDFCRIGGRIPEFNARIVALEKAAGFDKPKAG